MKIVLSILLTMFSFGYFCSEDLSSDRSRAKEVTDNKIIVEKGKEKWEIERTAGTKVTGDLKVARSNT